MKADKKWFNHTLIHGLILGLSLSLVEFAALFLGMLFRPAMFNIFVFLIAVSVYIAIRKYRETELKGLISFGDAFLTGFIVCVVAGAIWAIYRYFQYKYTPGLLDEILRLRIDLLDHTKLGKADRDFFAKMYQIITKPIILALFNTFFASMILGGSIISVLISIVLRRKELPNINKL